MRSFTLVLAACLLASALATPTFTTEQATCIAGLTQPCTTDATCISDFSKANLCLAEKCVSMTDASEFGKCISETCKSSNTAVAAYQSKYGACVSSQNLAFIAMALFSLLALLF